MRILVSNDDGIYAPGLRALCDAMRDLGEVHVVAPLAEQSAVGHAITISDPLRVRPVRHDGAFFGHGVAGTPADCVKVAVGVLLDAPPDLVVSGINPGPNAGINILYSGTVSAATEGTILGIPSMAVSLGAFADPLWETPASVARRLARMLLERGLPDGTLLNVNVPNLPEAELRGYAVTRMGRSRYIENFQERADPRGSTYYWMDGELEIVGEAAGTDIQAVKDGYVSLSPIRIDLTDRDGMEALRGWDF